MPALRRLSLALLIIIPLCAVGLYFFNQYWIHRYDALIARQSSVYRLDPDLVWSIIYEETYFRPWMRGDAGEVGLMQVTPAVAREWAAETGMRELAEQMRRDPERALADPERNIQVGCWYLEKIWKDYQDTPAPEWNRVPAGGRPLTAAEFVARIDFPKTRAYVTNIIERYRRKKDGR